ncbi:MAG: NFACT RNA binding domain-containing protein [Bacteroidota bacterium]
MFHNYFFLKRLTVFLHDKLLGLSLVECFSQNKNELVLAFGSQLKEFYIRASLDPLISLLAFPDSFARAGKNSVNLFEELIHQEVLQVETFQYERSFQIIFKSGEALVFKMHARRANILYSEEDRVKDIFRKNLRQDLQIIPSNLDQKITISEENFSFHEYDPIQLIPALGKDIKVSLESTGFYQHPKEEKWGLFIKLLSDLQHNPIFLINNTFPRISLIESSKLSTYNPIRASNWLYEAVVKKIFFDKEKEQLINQLKQRIKKSKNYILKTEQKLIEIEQSRNPEEVANILMANLHRIQPGLSKVVLTDIYYDNPITIKLNTNLTPQKNAENYYRKGKNRQQEIDALKNNLKEKQTLIHRLSGHILALLEIQTLKELRKYKKSHQFEKKQIHKQQNLPYYQFEIDRWQILVGKNSRANDELTLKVANKNDLWLHAKDVAGSHVVVRQIPGKNFPKYVIEYAASLAAANSKRKTDTLCPVIYTFKKFVRKVKRAPPGEVVVEKEEIIMIEPMQIGN